MPIDEGGQAFPVTDYFDMDGMTLRDYFAGQALPAIIGRPEWPELILAADEAYKIADAMIAERKKTGGPMD